MDSVEFTRGSRAVVLPEVNNTTKYVAQTLKGFQGATTPHCNVSLRKFSVYNKNPTNAKVIQRNSGKGGDQDLGHAALHFAALDYDSDYFVGALESGAVVLYQCSENADATVGIRVVETVEVPDVVSVTVVQRVGTTFNALDPRVGKVIVAVTSKGAVFSINAQSSPFVAEPFGELGGAIGAIGAGQGIVAFARGNKVILRSVDRLGGADILAKPWMPHGDDAVDFVHVFQRTTEALSVVTGAGAEFRLWKLKDAATLVQSVLIHGAADAGVTLKAVDPAEDFLFVAEKPSGSLLVLQIAQNGPMVERITEWSLGEEIVSISSAQRRVQAAEGSAPKTDLAAVARTATGLIRYVFDAPRLNGPVNLEAAAPKSSTSPAVQNDSVKKWFANTTPVVQPPATMTPAGFTHITSTTGGTTTTKSSVDARAAAEALQDVQAKFAAILSQFDTAIVALERQASDSLGVLRAGGAAATTAGETSARQNLGAIAAAVAQNSQADSTSYVINQDVLSGFTAAITDAATLTVTQALSAGLKHHAGNAADRAAAIVGNAGDREAIQLPKLTQLPSMQALNDAIDKAQAQQNDLFRRQKEQDAAKYKSLLRLQQEKATKTNAEAKKWFAELNAEITGLKEDIGSLQSWAPSSAKQPEETEEEIYADAMKLAEAGQWGNALFKIVNAGKLSLLNRFLETDLIKANKGEVANVSHMTVPLYISIAQQLTSDLGESVGLIPTRVDWLHQFTLAFDELVNEDPTGKHAKHAEDGRIQLSNVVDSLGEAEAHKSGLDRNTKRNMTVVKKVLGPHVL